jgi:membrane-bound metal-dependent hydrolase YbcI (DUF457 family)
MQTYSHLVWTVLLGKKLEERGLEVDREALWAGSVAPDVPLVLLSVGYVVDRRYIRRHLPDKTRCSPTFNELYFNNRWWIGAHNLLHAPFPLFVLGLVGVICRQFAWGRRLFWFVVGCGLHSAVDIVTHVDDGPVLFFPFDWQKRFKAPVSYWDAKHGGRVFMVVEHVLDIFAMVYLVIKWLKPSP